MHDGEAIKVLETQAGVLATARSAVIDEINGIKDLAEDRMKYGLTKAKVDAEVTRIKALSPVNIDAWDGSPEPEGDGDPTVR